MILDPHILQRNLSGKLPFKIKVFNWSDRTNMNLVLKGSLKNSAPKVKKRRNSRVNGSRFKRKTKQKLHQKASSISCFSSH